jgi:hypothetical protein
MQTAHFQMVLPSFLVGEHVPTIGLHRLTDNLHTPTISLHPLFIILLAPTIA